MIIYKFNKNANIPEQLLELKHKVVLKNYCYLSDTVSKDFDNYEYTKFHNYDLYVKDLIPDMIIRKHAKGEFIKLADNNDWMVRTLKDIDYVYSYDPLQDKIIKIFDDMFAKTTNSIISKGEDINELDLLEIITNSIVSNYCITKEVILYLNLINSKLIGELINKILCIDLLSNTDFFRKGDNPLQE